MPSNFYQALQNAQNESPEFTLGLQKQEMIESIINNENTLKGTLRDNEPTIFVFPNEQGCEHGFPVVSTHESRKIVTLCGSTRYALGFFQLFQLELTLKGFIVLTIGCDTHSDADLEAMGLFNVKKSDLDTLHFDKIKLSDIVMVLNMGQETDYDYVGESTGREVAYARKLGKHVWWLYPHQCHHECNCRVHV